MTTGENIDIPQPQIDRPNLLSDNPTPLTTTETSKNSTGLYLNGVEYEWGEIIQPEPEIVVYDSGYTEIGGSSYGRDTVLYAGTIRIPGTYKLEGNLRVNSASSFRVRLFCNGDGISQIYTAQTSYQFCEATVELNAGDSIQILWATSTSRDDGYGKNIKFYKIN